jgi:nitrogenase molybdenum-iron protein NifN
VKTAGQLSGRPVPAALRRQRSQLVDAMLDGHFHFGNVKVALAAEPDLLWAAGMLPHRDGRRAGRVRDHHALAAARAAAGGRGADRRPRRLRAQAQAAGCDLLMTHSHGRQAAQRLGKPLFRIGIPMFDRIGNAHICHVGYRGTRNFVYEVGNLLIEQIRHHGPGRLAAAGRVAPAACSGRTGRRTCRAVRPRDPAPASA